MAENCRVTAAWAAAGSTSAIPLPAAGHVFTLAESCTLRKMPLSELWRRQKYEAVPLEIVQSVARAANPGLQSEIEQIFDGVLARLPLRDLASLQATSRALRAVVQRAPNPVWQAAAELSGLPITLFHADPGSARQRLALVASVLEKGAKPTVRCVRHRHQAAEPSYGLRGLSCLCRRIPQRLERGTVFSPDGSTICFASAAPTVALPLLPRAMIVQLLDVKTARIVQQVGPACYCQTFVPVPEALAAGQSRSRRAAGLQCSTGHAA